MELKAVLMSVESLAESDQRQLLLKLLAKFALSASLEAWCDKDHVPQYTAPRPRFKSHCRKVRMEHHDDSPNFIAGCPWCRRPVAVAATVDEPPKAAPSLTTKHAYATLLYGKECDKYFLGALVVAEGLRQFANGREDVPLLLLHTWDVPKTYITSLSKAGWVCKEVGYLHKGVAKALFKKYYYSRFLSVFTKLRALQQMEFEKVLFLDLDILVRGSLSELFELRAPAAMKRGEPVMSHGQLIPYATLWGHPTRRATDSLPQHQQASGINAPASVMGCKANF